MAQMTTGQIIAKKRKEKGLNQLQLGEMLSVSNRTISKWENDDGLPDISILPALARVLDITIDELLTGEKAPVQEVLIEKKDKNKLIRNFRSCYIVALFLAIFGGLLGTVTEIYSIWTFNILFYTHWEIIFVALSLFCVVASGLVLTLGLNSLHFEYSKKELFILAGKRTVILCTILLTFPFSFAARIVDVSSKYGFVALAVFAVVLVILFMISMKCLRRVCNEKEEGSEDNN